MSGKTLFNTTLDFVGDINTQAFITAVQVVLNRYYFGRLIKLEFRYDHLHDMITMTAKIEYPLTPTNPRPITSTVQQQIFLEEISNLDSDKARSYIEHTVHHIIYSLALVQEIYKGEFQPIKVF